MPPLLAPRLHGGALHRATTRHLQSIYPGIANGTDGGTRGVYIGRDVYGGSFVYDPWELYAAGLITNPNMLVIGEIGRGKSALVKTYVWRQLVFGRQALMLDPKGENGPLCAAAGVTPVALRPDAGDEGVRLNPLDLGQLSDPQTRVQERVRVISAICGASLSRPLVPEERVAIELAVHAATPRVPWQAPTLPRVVDALLSPSERAAGEVHLSADELRTASRSVALELRRLVDGDLRGMFDSETSGDIDLQAPLVSFDLSAVYGTAALPILMACVGAWFQGVLTRDDQTKRIVVLDEAWAVLSNLETASWLRGSYKLARSYGVQYLAVLHRLADLSAAGDANSAQVRMARGLLADTETVVVYGQAPAEVDNTRGLLDLNDTEARLISTLPRGTALWRVGRRSHLVEHRVGSHERDLVDSDQRMRDGRLR
jgi:type IV secretory pathway VirB4 component